MTRRLWISVLVCWASVSSNAAPRSVSAAEATARFLTSAPGVRDYWPCFSPDGTTVLFSRRIPGRKPWELYVVGVDGSDVRRLARSPLPVTATRANWSTQTNQIAFTGTDGDGTSSVWVINGDGTNPRPVLVSGLSNRVLYPSWYPDGEHVAVMDASAEVIKRINLKRGTAVTVTDHRKVLTGMPAVSPNGKWIAFAGQKNTGQPYDQTKNSIWLVNDIGDLRTVEPVPDQGRTPAWSRDGRWLAFESNRSSSSQLYAAFIIDRDGTGLRQVTPFELNANHPAWSPDDAQLVFSARHTKDREATGIAIIDITKATP